MRLTRQQESDAIQELLGLLAANPSGIATSALSGTQRFHGSRTLKNAQIIRLLRKSGKAVEYSGGQGTRTFTVWKRLSDYVFSATTLRTS